MCMFVLTLHLVEFVETYSTQKNVREVCASVYPISVHGLLPGLVGQYVLGQPRTLLKMIRIGAQFWSLLM